MATTESMGGAGGEGGDMPIGGAGGSGGGGSGPVEAMTFADVRAFLDRPTENGSGCFDCHQVDGDLPYVFKNDDTLYTELTTRMITRCDNRLLVVPGEPENSALYLVLSGECGTVGKMPYGCVEDQFASTCTDPAKREALRLWIEQGAAE